MHDARGQTPACAIGERGRYGVFLTTLLVIVAAEMGDKTRLAGLALTRVF